ncbi:MAG: M20/M25/M40 family metallo-hydrolase [Spirochaetales bacterium]|nr:MAG: M20/M25/M40 family metallo-hydrolase [Spirochaetales bacterium]
MAMSFDAILDALPRYRERLAELTEIMLANLVMIAETPAPTFAEQRRMEFVLDRFNEYHLQNCSTDEAGNALGILPGRTGDRNILVVAHMDTVFTGKEDHMVTIQPGYVSGLGIGDDSLGVATVTTLPLILRQLEVELEANLILMGSAKSLGRGDIEGLRFFLNNMDIPISAGICVEGVKLGRLSYASIGMLRGEIKLDLPEEYDWTRFGAGGAIVNMNEVINRVLEIPIPRRPRTTIVFNSIEAGSGFNTFPTKGSLQFEVRSESGEIVRQLGETIQNITAEVSSHTGTHVKLEILARREPGGITFSHPLAAGTRTIMKSLGLNPRITPSTSELSAFIDAGIPAVTIGLTDGEDLNEPTERIEIGPMTTGLQQLLGLLLAVDKGYCDDYN